MGADASWPLERAILSALRDSERIRALLGGSGGVVSGVQSADTPVICYAAATARAWHSATFDGQDHEITLLLRTTPQDAEIGALAAAVTGRLHDADLPIPGHALIELQFERSETRSFDEDGIASCRLLFRALTVED
mgnify:CR=1 FL=1